MASPTDDGDIIKWLSIANRYTRIALDRQLLPYRLSASLYYYILRIHDTPKMTQDRLIELTHLNASNVTRAVNQLVALGYVRKRQSKADRRVYELSLTKRGQEIYPDIYAIRERVALNLLRQVPDDQRDVVKQLIQQLAETALANEQPDKH